MKGTGMTVAQLEVLKLVLAASAAELDQRELQTSLGVTSATLTRLLTTMERKHLIARASHPTDARGKTVRLTPKARRLFENLTDTREAQFAARLLSGFTKAETAALTRLLSRIADNMGGDEQA